MWRGRKRLTWTNVSALWHVAHTLKPVTVPTGKSTSSLTAKHCITTSQKDTSWRCFVFIGNPESWKMQRWVYFEMISMQTKKIEVTKTNTSTHNSLSSIWQRTHRKFLQPLAVLQYSSTLQHSVLLLWMRPAAAWMLDLLYCKNIIIKCIL